MVGLANVDMVENCLLEMFTDTNNCYYDNTIF